MEPAASALQSSGVEQELSHLRLKGMRAAKHFTVGKGLAGHTN